MTRWTFADLLSSLQLRRSECRRWQGFQGRSLGIVRPVGVAIGLELNFVK